MTESAPTELVVELPVSITDKVDETTRKLEEQKRLIERRRHPRLSVGLTAHCQIDGIVSQEALGDLSVGGLYLRTSAAVRQGARVRIVLGLPYIGGQRVCSLAGRVAWVNRGEMGEVRGAGVEFDQETESADYELLRGFLELWGSPRSNPPAASAAMGAR